MKKKPTPKIHGTLNIPAKHHPVFDLDLWINKFPLEPTHMFGQDIYRPSEIAFNEQARRTARKSGELGPSVPADIFVWADWHTGDKPWLTRIGGVPWRESDRPWPRDRKRRPLVFLGQICFADSADILPHKLPGDVALIFGTYSTGWVTIEESALEWSPLQLKSPADRTDTPAESLLPMELHGVIHRTIQYTDREIYEPVFDKAGFNDMGWKIGATQATQIGAHANLPQGWPFKENDGKTLIACLSSFYLRKAWPLCNISRTITFVHDGGGEHESGLNSCADFGIEDAGCIWIYRDKKGAFHLGSAGG